MKKLLILAMAFGLAACATDDAGLNGKKPSGGDPEANYLAINIAAATGGTRAYTDGSDYQDGWQSGAADPMESKVTSIRFYFFNNGAAASVDLTSGASYRDFTVPTGGFADDGNDTPNVEHKLKATVVLHRTIQSGSSQTAGFPNQVIAILNPTDKIKTDLGSTPSLDEVKAYLTEGLAYTDGESTDPKAFVMTNSVYVADGGTTVDAVAITADNIKSSAEAAVAEGAPVSIYVERVVAKLDLSIKANTTEYWDDEEQQPKLKAETVGSYNNAYNTYVEYDGKPIYVVLQGWNVTATADKSHLIKHIDETWAGANGDEATLASNLFKTANEPWNYAMFHRSYWGYNPAGVSLQYGSFNKTPSNLSPSGQTNVNPAMGNTFGETNLRYMPENAGESATAAANKYPTQVIIAAKLIDDEGNELALGEFMGTKFKYNSDDDVKNFVLNALTKYYKKEDNKYVELTTTDLEIKTALQLDPTLLAEDKDGRYYVYAQLNEDALGETWYTYNGSYPIPEDVADTNFSQVAQTSSINDALKLLPAKVWKSGNTYYYFDIRHLSASTNPTTTPGYYGVVRNHVYKTNVNGIFGLGTPVYDPDEIIIPEKPKEEDVYMAAEINILSWRIVNQDVELEW